MAGDFCLPCQREVPSIARRRDSCPAAGITDNKATPIGIPPAAFGVHLPLTREASACQKTSLWETDSPDTGEVALAPEGERWPEGPEGENLAFARNLRACVKLSPPPPAGGAPSQRGPRSFSTICTSLCQGRLFFYTPKWGLLCGRPHFGWYRKIREWLVLPRVTRSCGICGRRSLRTRPTRRY